MCNVTSCLLFSVIGSMLRGTEFARLSKADAPVAIVVSGAAFDLQM